MGNACLGPSASTNNDLLLSASTAPADPPPHAPAHGTPPQPIQIPPHPSASPPTNRLRKLPSAGLQVDSVLRRRASSSFKEAYVLGRKLGQGQFGITHLCVDRATGRELACKSIAKRRLVTEDDVEDVRREVEIMHHLSGQANVVAIAGAYEDATYVHVVMELCAGGELFDRIVGKGCYSEREAARLGRVIVGAMEACHSMGVMHRDLKPENFLFVDAGEESMLKLIDFGLSVFFQPAYYFNPKYHYKNGLGTNGDLLSAVQIVVEKLVKDEKLQSMCMNEVKYYRDALGSFGRITAVNGRGNTLPGEMFTDLVGSAYYVAPEVLDRKYGPEADVWSAGVIIYILLCGVPPFWGESDEQIFEQVCKGYLDFESDPWPNISDSAKDLIRRILVRDPKKRLTAHEVLCHPWIQADGVAPDRPLDSAVLSRLKQFSATNKFKKMALRVIAESLSEEEIAGLTEMFKMIDTDNSGYITFEELKAGLERVGADLKDSEIYILMQAADIDNSGTIDYGEFIAATLHLNKIEREDRLFAAFCYFDKDGSGYITQDELQQVCEEFGIHDAQLEDMIQEVDQDNDGRIDYNEFVAMMQQGDGGGFSRKGLQKGFSISFKDSPRLAS